MEAEDSPAGQRAVNLFFSSEVRVLFGGAKGIVESKREVSNFLAEEGLVDGVGCASKSEGFVWI